VEAGVAKRSSTNQAGRVAGDNGLVSDLDDGLMGNLDDGTRVNHLTNVGLSQVRLGNGDGDGDSLVANNLLLNGSLGVDVGDIRGSLGNPAQKRGTKTESKRLGRDGSKNSENNHLYKSKQERVIFTASPRLLLFHHHRLLHLQICTS